MPDTSLPIQDVLPALLDALRAGPNAVLVAPPGAGKTTAVAPALLAEPWCTGQLWLLSPRRIAARAAAERMADMLGEKVGGTIGYVTRLDSRQSAATRILVVTQGVFLRRVQDDPALEGVSAVIFDEVHERSLDGDFAMALAIDAQGGLREDLRLLAMSATLDGARFAAMMAFDGHDAPVVESEGRSHAVALRHIGRDAAMRIEDAMAAAVALALAETQGDILCFLPGVGEIERTAERLRPREGAIAVHRLHGMLDPTAQRHALRPAGDGRRKVILATSIAETSLTIDGVRVVVDSGLARRPVHDVAAGVTRLVTQRASRAAAIQRAGRAGRQAPGIAYRLWEEAATGGLAAYDRPEILTSDLSALRLDCALWGVTNPTTLRWLDPPPAAALQEAGRRLQAIGALDDEGRATRHGRAIAALPLDPRLAHMLLYAGNVGLGELAAQIAVLLTERGLGGNDVDLAARLERWRRDEGQRAEAARGLAIRWAKLAGRSPEVAADTDADAAATCVSIAFPDRVARRRSSDGKDWISAGGRAFHLDPLSPLARAEWLAVGEVQGVAAGARILSAAAIDGAAALRLFADRIAERRTVCFRTEIGGVEATREQRLGAIRLSSGNDDAPVRAAVIGALAGGLSANGLDVLPWPDGARSLRIRATYAGETALGDAALLEDAEAWLDEVLPDNARRFAAIAPGALVRMLENRLGWDGQRRVDRAAPRHFASPVGTLHEIDYGGEGGPRVELRVQALFGVAQHPVVGEERVPLVLSLTSPAGRPIQTTRDLPAFWQGSWAEVAKEMRGRYPKHPWPDHPEAATPTLRTKKADARSR